MTFPHTDYAPLSHHHHPILRRNNYVKFWKKSYLCRKGCVREADFKDEYEYRKKMSMPFFKLLIISTGQRFWTRRWGRILQRWLGLFYIRRDMRHACSKRDHVTLKNLSSNMRQIANIPICRAEFAANRYHWFFSVTWSLLLHACRMSRLM